MQRALIHRFFKELNQELKRPADVILTGAAAGSLLGVGRSSLDIDFQIKILPGKKRTNSFEVRNAIQRAAEKIGIAVNYSEDIGHWSMIDLMDYEKTSLPCPRVGQLHIRIMAPGHWTIGKMARFLEVDIQDVQRIIKRREIKSGDLIPLWGRAFRSSRLSLELGIFRRNVAYFIKRYGKRVWGKKFGTEKGIALFQSSCGIK